MIDIRTEQLEPVLPLLERILGKKPHPSTVCRYQKGMASGAKLEVMKVGGKIYTSLEAVQRFIDACSRDQGELTDVRILDDGQAAGKGFRLSPPTDAEKKSLGLP